MTKRLRRALPALVSTALLVVLGGGALAASPQAASARHASTKMDRLSISITTTSGTVWGTVSARYSYRHRQVRKSCSSSLCRWKVPNGVTVHLSQSATNTSTWPFQDWLIASGHRTKTAMGSSTAFKVRSNVSVTAVYVVASSGNPYP